MQRVHVDDLVAHVLEKGEWDVLDLPAIADKNEAFVLLNGEVVGRRAGEPLHVGASRCPYWRSNGEIWGSFTSTRSINRRRFRPAAT